MGQRWRLRPWPTLENVGQASWWWFAAGPESDWKGGAWAGLWGIIEILIAPGSGWDLDLRSEGCLGVFAGKSGTEWQQWDWNVPQPASFCGWGRRRGVIYCHQRRCVRHCHLIVCKCVQYVCCLPWEQFTSIMILFTVTAEWCYAVCRNTESYEGHIYIMNSW